MLTGRSWYEDGFQGPVEIGPTWRHGHICPVEIGEAAMPIDRQELGAGVQPLNEQSTAKLGQGCDTR
jgi:hypothetical protein